MADKRNNYPQKRCDGCNNFLRWSTQKGYYCEWCGYQEKECYEEVVDENHEKPFSDKPAYSTNNRNVGRKVPIILSVIGVFLFGIIFIASSMINPSTTRKSNTSSSNEKPSVEKPKMLTTLPKAVKAGTAVTYNNWELIVEPEFSVSNNQLYFRFSIQNWNDNSQILRFEVNTFIVYDNHGKIYPLHLGRCSPDLPYLNRQLSFDPFTKLDFQSNSLWCNQEQYIPSYSGVISQDVDNIYFHFEEFGVFQNITFVFDL